MAITKNIKFTIIILIFNIIISPIYSNTQNKNILIINSYSKEVKWSKDLADSITNNLHKNQENINVMNLNLNLDFNTQAYTQTAKLQLLDILNNNSQINNIVIIGNQAYDLYNNIGKDSTINIKPIVVSNTKINNNSNYYTEIGFTVPIKENLEIMRYLSNYQEIVFIDKDTKQNIELYKAIESELKNSNMKEKISSYFVTSKNIDSVYQYINNLKKDKIIITNIWNFKDPHNKFTNKQVDSLLNKTQAPIISLTPNTYNNNYIVGGYNLSIKFCSDKVIDAIKKINSEIGYTSSNYEEVKNGNIILNNKAIKKYNLPDISKYYFEISIINKTENILITYKYYIIPISILIIILVTLIIIICRNKRKIKVIENELNKKRKKEEEINCLMQGDNENFIIIDDQGDILYKIISKNIEEILGEHITLNIFDSFIFNKEEINDIRNKKNLIKFLDINDALLYFTIKPVPRSINQEFKYLITITKFNDIRSIIQDNILYQQLTQTAIEYNNIGIATYNILNGEGFATENWYTNLMEKKNSSNIAPSYKNIEDCNKITISKFLEECKNGNATNLEILLNIKDLVNGKNKWIKNNLYLKEYNPSQGIIKILDVTYDITRDKYSETKLLNRQKEISESLNDTNNFINNLNHALRIPLTSILGFANTLIGLKESEEKEEITRIIKKNNEQLIEIINNVLLICKLESNKYIFNKTDIKLNDLIKELKTATEYMISTDKENNNIEVLIDIPADEHILSSDEYNFKQVMVNLIANAIKHTEKGTIVLGYHHNNNGYYFYIKDTGTGIPQNFKKLVFNKFEKGENSTGTGLGLSICKAIITKLGGQIGVNSQEGEGSTFWFTLNH